MAARRVQPDRHEVLPHLSPTTSTGPSSRRPRSTPPTSRVPARSAAASPRGQRPGAEAELRRAAGDPHRLQTNAVSATLGKSSLEAGFLAGLLGLVLVMLYTIFYYRPSASSSCSALSPPRRSSSGSSPSSASRPSGSPRPRRGHRSHRVGRDHGRLVHRVFRTAERRDPCRSDDPRLGRQELPSAYRTILSADAVSFIAALVLWLLWVGDVRGFAFMLGLSTLVDVVTSYTFTRPLVICSGATASSPTPAGWGWPAGSRAPPRRRWSSVVSPDRIARRLGRGRRRHGPPERAPPLERQKNHNTKTIKSPPSRPDDEAPAEVLGDQTDSSPHLPPPLPPLPLPPPPDRVPPRGADQRRRARATDRPRTI